MNLLSLSSTEFGRLLKIFSFLTLIIFGIVFFIRWKCFNATLFSATWQAFSIGVSINTVLFSILTSRVVFSRKFAKLLGRPIVHGVWFGTLKTNFQELEGKEIPIYFVIKQTFLSLSIESFTDSQEGESKLEVLVKNAKTDAIQLYYIYELRRQYEGENKLTTGSGELKLQNDGTLLKGHYWTNSPTQGNIALNLKSHTCTGVDSFETAQKICQVST